MRSAHSAEAKGRHYQNNNEKMKEIFYAIWIPLMIGGLIWAVIVGVNRTERVECFKWKEQAKTFPAFYITQWQKEQCDYNGITIDAPVK